MNGELYTVVGVLEPGQSDRLESKLFVPLSFKPDQMSHDVHWLLTMGADEAGRDAAASECGTWHRLPGTIAEIYPASK